MNWHRLPLSALVLVVAGCSDLSIRRVNGNPGSSVARLQKPETKAAKPAPPKTLLDMPPEPQGDPIQGKVAVKILATVGNVPILEEEVAEARARYILSMPESERRAFNSLPPSERTRTENDISKLVLDQLIDREVVLQEAMRRLGTSQGQRQLDKIRELAGKEFDKQLRTIKTQHRLKTDEDVKNFLRDQGVSVDALRRQAEREFLYMEYIRYRVAPALERIGHREIVDYYHRHPEEFQTVDSVQWQDIFIAAAQHPSRELARRLAEQILARVQAGEDFAQLAAEYDGGVSRIRSGQGQGRRRGEIQPPEVEPILFQMQDGQVGPLVELPTGFHIIRLVQRDYAGQVPLDAKTQNQIRDKLRNEVFRREAKRTVEELRRRATIERSSPLP